MYYLTSNYSSHRGVHNRCDITTNCTSKCNFNNHCLKIQYYFISPLKYHNYENSVIHYSGKITENIKNRNKGSSKNHENNKNNSINSSTSINSSRGAER